eukprot:747627-Hanusia_phi.AAC.8
MMFAALSSYGVVCDMREPDVIRLAPCPLYNTFHEVYRVVDMLVKLNAMTQDELAALMSKFPLNSFVKNSLMECSSMVFPARRYLQGRLSLVVQSRSQGVNSSLTSVVLPHPPDHTRQGTSGRLANTTASSAHRFCRRSCNHSSAGPPISEQDARERWIP